MRPHALTRGPKRHTFDPQSHTHPEDPLASTLWRGSWQTQARIITGLILFVYAFFHFVNLGLGLISPIWMEAMQDAMNGVVRNPVGSTLLHGSLFLHAGRRFWAC